MLTIRAGKRMLYLRLPAVRPPGVPPRYRKPAEYPGSSRARRHERTRMTQPGGAGPFT